MQDYHRVHGRARRHAGHPRHDHEAGGRHGRCARDDQADCDGLHDRAGVGDQHRLQTGASGADDRRHPDLGYDTVQPEAHASHAAYSAYAANAAYHREHAAGGHWWRQREAEGYGPCCGPRRWFGRRFCSHLIHLPFQLSGFRYSRSFFFSYSWSQPPPYHAADQARTTSDVPAYQRDKTEMSRLGRLGVGDDDVPSNQAG